MLTGLRCLIAFFRLRRRIDPAFAYLLSAAVHDRTRLPRPLSPRIPQAEAQREVVSVIDERRNPAEAMETVFGADCWDAVEEFKRRAEEEVRAPRPSRGSETE